MKKLVTVCTLAAVIFGIGGIVQAGFDAFVIRNGASGGPTIQANNDYVPGATEFVIGEGGMKAALGSNDINGITIAGISQLSITRLDDTSRFSGGSGPAVAPYFNIWVTDRAGKFATISNQPSRGDFQPLFEETIDGSNTYHTYDLSYADLADKSLQVYETVSGGYGSTSTWVHDLCGNHELTFADIASLTIAPPSAAYIQDSANAVGSGAADVLGTNEAYGFNWVFGDTLSNYVSGAEGYVVSDFNAVPEPSTFAMLGLGAISLMLIRRKR